VNGLGERVAIPAELQRRLDRWKAGGALLWCAVVGWFALVRGQRVPFVELADLGLHELGHVIFWQLTHDELVMLVMGNGFQVLFPLAAGIAFVVLNGNRIALGVCLAWCASAIADTAVYVFDAPRGELALVGFGPIGDESEALGDWSRVLGPEHLDKLFLADAWAANLRVLAVIVWLAAVAVVGVGLIRTRRDVRRDARTSASLPAPLEARSPAITRRAAAPTGDTDRWR
jgi:hypothetical protein